MTAEEKIEFVRKLTDSIKQDVIDCIRADRIPEEWDSHELRELLADRFDKERSLRGAYGNAAMRDYRRALLDNDLLY